MLPIDIHIGLSRKILCFATDQGLISAVGLKFPRLPESQKTYASPPPQELAAFIQHFSNDMTHKQSLVGVCTGMRPSELAYLSWHDVDLINVSTTNPLHPKKKTRRQKPASP